MNLSSDQPTFTPRVKKDSDGQSKKDNILSSALSAKKKHLVSNMEPIRPSHIEWDKNDSYLSQDVEVERNAEHVQSATQLPSVIKEKEGVWDFYHGCSVLGDTSSSKGGKNSENVPSSSSRRKKSIESSTVGTKGRKKPAVLNKRGAENEWNESGSDDDEEEEEEEEDDAEECAALDLSTDRDDNKG